MDGSTSTLRTQDPTVVRMALAWEQAATSRWPLAASGSLLLATGQAREGSAGDVLVAAGSGVSGAGGSVQILAGASLSENTGG